MLTDVLKMFVKMKATFGHCEIYNDTLLVKGGIAQAFDTSLTHCVVKLQFKTNLPDGTYGISSFLNRSPLRKENLVSDDDFIEADVCEPESYQVLASNIPEDAYPFILPGLEGGMENIIDGSCIEMDGEHWWVCATDGHVLHVYASHLGADLNQDGVSFVLEHRLTNMLAKCGKLDVSYNKNDKKLYFSFPGGTLTVLMRNSMMEKKYPNWRALIPSIGNRKIAGRVDELKRVGEWCKFILKIDEKSLTAQKYRKNQVMLVPVENGTEIHFQPNDKHYYTMIADKYDYLEPTVINWQYLDGFLKHVDTWFFHSQLGRRDSGVCFFQSSTEGKLAIVMPFNEGGEHFNEEKILIDLPKKKDKKAATDLASFF